MIGVVIGYMVGDFLAHAGVVYNSDMGSAGYVLGVMVIYVLWALATGCLVDLAIQERHQRHKELQR